MPKRGGCAPNILRHATIGLPVINKREVDAQAAPASLRNDPVQATEYTLVKFACTVLCFAETRRIVCCQLRTYICICVLPGFGCSAFHSSPSQKAQVRMAVSPAALLASRTSVTSCFRYGSAARVYARSLKL